MANSDIIKELQDRQAITDLIYRYCRAVDRIDRELGYSIWHPDSHADYGDFYKGDGTGVIDMICQQHSRALAHSHQVANILISLDGDTAGSEAYITATVRVQNEDRLLQIVTWNRYIDSWSLRDGRWGLDRRICLRDFDEVREAAPMNDQSDGRRDRNDASYQVL